MTEEDECVKFMDLMEARLSELRTLIEGHMELDSQRQRAHELALDKATVALDKRLDALNEFRETFTRTLSSYLPRTEYDARHESLAAATSQLGLRITTIEAAQREQSLITERSDKYKLSVPSIVIGIVSVAIAITSLTLAIILR